MYAHTRPPPASRNDWEPLLDHLRRVAEGDGVLFPGASGFAEAFGAKEWGRLCGWWHDIGKYSDAFQRYLEQANPEDGGHRGEMAGRIDHSTAGAQHAASNGATARLMAYCIAGHHAGLPNGEGGTAALSERLRKLIEPFDAAPREILDMSVPKPPILKLNADRPRPAFAAAFFTRMLFSCLVDADFLATEQFMSPGRAAMRRRAQSSMAEMLARLDTHLNELENDATEINRERARILNACRQKAVLSPGFFSLNVPTGGGKTLSSLAFALTHAATHGKRAVVYAIPFTSIIEQTAHVFRKALGDMSEDMLEYHSSLASDDPRNQSEQSRLAAENFDSPLVVTTNVQLFESLFANRTSRCRKLHRLAQSVIILDEAQTLPPNLLEPTLAALDELVRNYGASVVLCTATQPAIERRGAFPIGLRDVTPIIDDAVRLHSAMRRVTVESAGTLTDEALAARLAKERQVLCVVNTRKHAADLLILLDDPHSMHLSASMCAQHRTATLRLIRWKLKRGHPCRVISTQVIEAGVDVDFPCVYRATAGLDSIAQAAGRCNREGILENFEKQRCFGRLVVFDYDEKLHRPPPFIRRAAGHYREVVPAHEGDILSPTATEAYFRLHYWQEGGDDGRGWDRGYEQKSVMRCFGGEDSNPLHHQFRDATEAYRMIDDAQTQVVVGYGPQGHALISELASMPEDPQSGRLRAFDRAAQRYVVGVWDRDLRKLLHNHVLVECHERYYLANSRAYDRKLGLTFDSVGFDPGLLQQ